MSLKAAIAILVAAMASTVLGAVTFRPVRDALPSYPQATSRLEKPTVNPPVTDLDEYLLKQLMYMKSTIKAWEHPGIVNEDCRQAFLDEGYEVSNIEMFNVTYQDCEKPWAMCRHKNAFFQQNLTAEYFARIPIGMRQYIRHIIALPFDNHGGSAVYADASDNIILKGKSSLTQIIAATAGILAYNGYESRTPYWETENWNDAYDADSAVLNTMSQISQEENLKQMTVIALYDAQVPKRFQYRIPEWKKIENQYTQIEKDVRPGTLNVRLNGTEVLKCSSRLPDSDLVEVAS